jgi:hypothetical protein
MDTGGGGEPVVRGGEGEGAVGGGGRFADHDHVPETGRPGALQNLGAVRVVARVGQVAVGVDEHRAISYQPSVIGHQLSTRTLGLAGVLVDG